MHGVGHVWQEGSAWPGGGGLCGRIDGHCSGRYASYWNAFLLNDFNKVVMQIVS